MYDSESILGRAHMENKRIPFLGKVLRKTHLDELPELLLILMNKESFVGPRPLMKEHSDLVFSKERFAIIPGWTGYAQLYLRKKGVLPSKVQRSLDRNLSLNMSPSLYWKLLFGTFLSLFWKRGKSDPGKIVKQYRKNLLKNKNVLILLLLICPFPCFSQIAVDFSVLKNAYPGMFQSYHDSFIQCVDDTVLVYDDGKRKDFQQLLDNPDIEDMLSQSYPLGQLSKAPATNFDPGRFRPEAFFRFLYGHNEEIIRKNLVKVHWNENQVFLVQQKFGIANRLKAAISELRQLPLNEQLFLDPPGGTFNYRYISGTNRLSMHSFGIAVDIRVETAQYWKWADDDGAEYRNSIPYSIVEIFEKYGFIWGGKWYHYDTMHFEYRPEILLKAGGVIQNPPD